MAEYKACILGLRLTINMNVRELLVIRDSDLLVHQVLGEWATKNTKILPYLHCVQDLIKRFTKIEFKHVPRIQNEFADALATLSSMIQHPNKNFIDPIPIEIRKQPSYCARVEEEFDGNPWFHDIKKPQMNGAVEVANKIKKILRNMVDNYKQWHEKLPFALLGYRTTLRTSTGATPYLLVYSTEADIPAEVEIPSLRIIQEAKLNDAEWIRSRYEQQDLIDSKRMNVVCHGQLYQNRMARAFNKKVRSRQFTPGQFVLKRILSHHDEAKGKFSPNRQGPYMVHRVLTGGALILADMDGEIWPKPINSDTVKRYYV
ncbi:uncharacterized protein [Nicotiana tomentosiformis]|uniref:uncharacterized protein n=1 Tax=Nicotiana tomentosiformis TaxID=4098 RepID=UPI00388C491D